MQKIQCCAFARQQRTCVADKLADDIVVHGRLAVAYIPVNEYVVIKLMKDFINPGLAGEYEGLSGDDRRSGEIIGIDERRGQVTVTDVFSERVGDVAMYGSV